MSVHHLHSVLVKFGLLLLPLSIGDGLLLLALAALHDATDQERGEENTSARNGTDDDARLGTRGEGLPEAADASWLFDLLEDGGVAPTLLSAMVREDYV